jgi:hypothetical protein
MQREIRRLLDRQYRCKPQSLITQATHKTLKLRKHLAFDLNAEMVNGVYIPNNKKILLAKIRLREHSERIKALFDGIVNGIIYVFDLLQEVEENGGNPTIFTKEIIPKTK